MDKIILVFYINVCGLSRAKAEEVFKNMIESFDGLPKENIISIYIPLYGEGDPNRVECINPKYISKEEYDKIIEMTNLYKEKLTSHLNKED